MHFDRAMFCVIGFLITRNSCMILIRYVVLLVFIPKRQKPNKQKKQNKSKTTFTSWQNLKMTPIWVNDSSPTVCFLISWWGAQMPLPFPLPDLHTVPMPSFTHHYRSRWVRCERFTQTSPASSQPWDSEQFFSSSLRLPHKSHETNNTYCTGCEGWESLKFLFSCPARG